MGLINKKKLEHLDDAERIKQSTLSSARRRRMMGKITFYIMIAIAAALLALCFYSFIFE